MRNTIHDVLDKLVFRHDTRCWEWAASRRNNYGQAYFGGKRLVAHRLIYEHLCGPIPPGMFVCHRCDNPPCCNPAHLFLGTNMDNVRDAMSKGRLKRRQHGPPDRRRHYASKARRGEGNGRAKLSEGDVIAIRQSHSSGELAASIAARFKITAVQVRQIARGLRWRHLRQ